MESEVIPDYIGGIHLHLQDFLKKEKFRVYKCPPHIGYFQFSIGEIEKKRRLNVFLCDDHIYFNESELFKTGQTDEELTVHLEDLSNPAFFDDVENILRYFRQNACLPRYDVRSWDLPN